MPSVSELVAILKGDMMRMIEGARTLEELERVRVFWFGRKGVVRDIERALWGGK